MRRHYITIQNAGLPPRSQRRGLGYGLTSGNRRYTHQRRHQIRSRRQRGEAPTPPASIPTAHRNHPVIISLPQASTFTLATLSTSTCLRPAPAHHDYYRRRHQRHLTTSWTITFLRPSASNLAYVGFHRGLARSRPVKKSKRGPSSVTAGAIGCRQSRIQPRPGTYLQRTNRPFGRHCGATIFYTLDGTLRTRPSARSTFQYSAAITVSSSKTIKAIATAPNFSASAVRLRTYVIQTQTAAPTFPRLPELTSPPKRYPGQHNFRCAHFLHARRHYSEQQLGGSTFQYTPPGVRPRRLSKLSPPLPASSPASFRGHLHHQHQRFRCN